MTWSLALALALIAWATLAGLDLASVLQVLVSRPVVAGPVAGLILGDPATGLRVGVALELFALDVVPVGAARYPDFSAATVGAVIYAAGTAWPESLGAAVGLGLVLAGAAGATVPLTRRINAIVVRAYSDRLARGDPGAVRAAHLTCLGNDLARSTILAVAWVGLGLWLATAGVRPGPQVGRLLTLTALAGGAWAVAHGAMASARAGPRWRWALAGLLVGSLGLMVEW